MTSPDPEKSEIVSDLDASSWVGRLLRAESSWLAPKLVGAERALWLSPYPASGLDPAMAHLSLRADTDRKLTGDVLALSEAWPLADEVLDHVVLQHPLESGLELGSVLAEAMRVLRPERELWLFASGPLSLLRLRLASRLQGALRWPEMVLASRIESMLRDQGCSEIQRIAFSGLDEGGTLRPHPPWAPFPPILMVRARKRRSAVILRPRGIKAFSGNRLPALPAFPASRVGLAA